MKRVTVSLTDERCVVLTQIAEKQRRTLGNLCSFLLSGAPECVESLTNSASGVIIDPDAAGDYAPERSCENSGVAAPAPPGSIAVPQCVVTAQIAAPSLDVTADERAAHAAKRAEADQKRRALFVAMGVTHPADAPLPAKFLPGEADFLKAHPELA